jgi:hypothetical protein
MRNTGRWLVSGAVVGLVGLLGLGGWLVAPQPTRACPFCSAQGKTLTEEINQAQLVVFGTLKNPKADPGSLNGGTTEMVVEAVIKPDPYINGKKSLVLPRYVPPSSKPMKYLVYCDIFQGQLDPYRGDDFQPDTKIVAYLQGALALKDKDAPTRLRYFFDYLDSPELRISEDAYREFGYSDYEDYRKVAEKLPADRVRGWLADPNTPTSRLGLYGSMIGHCGKAEDAELVRKLLDDPTRLSTGMDGILAGYVMLDRKAGWEFLTKLLADERKDFVPRYAGLRAIRFFWEYRPDVVPKTELLAAFLTVAKQKDIADLAIEDLRKYQQWQPMETILGLAKAPTHQAPIIQRAILRYALVGQQHSPAAKAFVAQARKADPEKVADVEELLELEMRATPVDKK